MSKKHNVLIVGAGKIGSIRAHVIRKTSPGSKIFIYDTDKIRAVNLANEVKGTALTALKKGLENKAVGIVIVSVVNKFAKTICLQALNNKKHVLCEKPMGRNYSEAKQIYYAVKQNKMKFKCGFNHRYHPAFLEAHSLYKKGLIGKVLYIRAVYGHGGRSGYEKEWRADKVLCGGGELLDQGSHLIDLSLWFFGFDKVKKAYCIARPLFWKMKVEDNAFVTFETQKGKIAHLHATWTQWKNMFRFEMYGTKGAIEINGLGKSYGTESMKFFKKVKAGKPPNVIEKIFRDNDGSWEREWLDFIASIKSKKEPMSGPKESLEIMRTINMLYNQ